MLWHREIMATVHVTVPRRYRRRRRRRESSRSSPPSSPSTRRGPSSRATTVRCGLPTVRIGIPLVPFCAFACLRRAARAGARRSGRVALAAHSAPLRVLAVSGTASSKEEGPAGTGPIIQRGSAVGPAGPTAQAGWPGPLRAAVCHRRESNARQAEAPAPSTVLGGIAWVLGPDLRVLILLEYPGVSPTGSPW